MPTKSNHKRVELARQLLGDVIEKAALQVDTATSVDTKAIEKLETLLWAMRKAVGVSNWTYCECEGIIARIAGDTPRMIKSLRRSCSVLRRGLESAIETTNLKPRDPTVLAIAERWQSVIGKLQTLDSDAGEREAILKQSVCHQLKVE